MLHAFETVTLFRSFLRGLESERRRASALLAAKDEHYLEVLCRMKQGVGVRPRAQQQALQQLLRMHPGTLVPLIMVRALVLQTATLHHLLEACLQQVLESRQ